MCIIVPICSKRSRGLDVLARETTMQQAKADERVLCGVIEALIGGSVLTGILAVAFFLSATIMPNVGQKLTHMTDRTSVFAVR
ncbi:MAG: hypothetical protein B7Y88_07100 [Sphingomonadales bacterium 32-64-17]|nr:MAG: hypothetical protein B7Y88_07100 [Sphingomonadales bacterium 32-64-17]